MGSTEIMNKAITRATTVPTYADAQEGYFQVNTQGSLLGGQGLPERTEVNRLGVGVVIATAAVVTLAGTAGLPTTTAPSYIWNGEPATGKTYLVDRIAWNCTSISAGAASFFQIIACVGRQPVAQPATIDTVNAYSTNGRRYTGRCGTGHAATVVNDGWFGIGSSTQTALSTTIGIGCDALMDGAIILPPGFLLSLGCIGTNATSSGQFFITIYEVQITNTI